MYVLSILANMYFNQMWYFYAYVIDMCTMYVSVVIVYEKC